MGRHDDEIDRLKAEVNCAVILERASPPWRLDRRASTAHCLKYRCGASEILIVNHEGRGWWDPQSDAKGDAFTLVQHQDPSLSFGQARQVLRAFVGLKPAFPEATTPVRRNEPDLPVAERWARRPPLEPGSQAWRYLIERRCLPPSLLRMAIAIDGVREGFYGGAWFAHRADDGSVSHVEARGPRFKGSLRGGSKTLFRLSDGMAPKARLVLTEAPIDALSMASLEQTRPDTLYLATGGGMGPMTLAAIAGLLRAVAPLAGAVLCGATDADAAGDRYAIKHRALATGAGVRFERLRPSVEGGDWNDVLKTLRRRTAA